MSQVAQRPLGGEGTFWESGSVLQAPLQIHDCVMGIGAAQSVCKDRPRKKGGREEEVAPVADSLMNSKV